MGKPGRPTDFNERIQATIVRLIKEGKTEAEIAGLLSISKTTLQNWKGKHPDFLVAVRQAREVADTLVEAALFSRAIGCSHPETKVFIYEGCPVTEEITKHYPPDTQAAMFWLRNRKPKEWREKNEGDVTVNNTTQVTGLTDEQLDARIAAMLAKEPKNEKTDP